MCRYLMYLVILVSGIACKPTSEVELPSDEELVSLIHDLHLAETSMARVHIAMQDSVSMELRKLVAKSHGIAPEQMDTWLEELQRSPDHLRIVYDSVIARFEREVPGK